MVSLIVGFPGSGKTYYAIDKIHKIMSNKHDLSEDIEIIYSNINGLNIELFPKSEIILKKFNIDDFLKYINECFELYDLHKNEHDVDEYLIEFSKNNNYFNCLIIFDECHDFLSNQDRVKIFWLTYHRHLHHEIDLLTQNKTLINSKYRAIPEIFIEAQPRSKKLFSNTLNYKYYASFAMRKIDMFNTSSIKTDKEVFELYKSGNESHQKSIIKKFIYILFIGIILASVLFYKLFNTFSNDENTKSSNTEQIKEIFNKEPENIEDSNNDNLVLLIQQYSKDGYLIYDHYYSVVHFRKFIKHTNSKVLSSYYIYRSKRYFAKSHYLRTTQEKLSEYFILNEPLEDDINETDEGSRTKIKN